MHYKELEKLNRILNEYWKYYSKGNEDIFANKYFDYFNHLLKKYGNKENKNE